MWAKTKPYADVEQCSTPIPVRRRTESRGCRHLVGFATNTHIVQLLHEEEFFFIPLMQGGGGGGGPAPCEEARVSDTHEQRENGELVCTVAVGRAMVGVNKAHGNITLSDFDR